MSTPAAARCSTHSAAAPQEHEEGAYAALRDITAYFGEVFDETDPSRVLRIVRDFLGLYEKALAELEARAALRPHKWPVVCIQGLFIPVIPCHSTSILSPIPVLNPRMVLEWSRIRIDRRSSFPDWAKPNPIQDGAKMGPLVESYLMLCMIDVSEVSTDEKALHVYSTGS